MPLLHDLRHAVRLLRRTPGFSAAVILLLGLGIGANAAIFSVVDGVFLRPLPFGNGDRVVSVWGTNPGRGWTRFGASLPDVLDWQTEVTQLENITPWWTGAGNVTVGARAERITYGTASPSLFQALGSAPALGRLPRPEEDIVGHDGVAVVSQGFWRRTLGADPDAIGRTILLDGQPLEVIGVMPAGFGFPSADVDFWKPLGLGQADFDNRGARWVGVVASLPREGSLALAQPQLNAVARRLAEEYPRTNTGWTARVEPFRTTAIADQQPVIMVAWAAVGLILLIATANVANLLLARVARRERELAVRAALGARRAVLVRQLLAEGLVFSALGALLGLGGAALGMRALTRLVPAGLPGFSALHLNSWNLLYSAGIALAAGLAFGIAPALRGARVDLEPLLRGGNRSAGGRRHRGLRGALVTGELALAALVLVAAGLTVRSLHRVLRVDPGFDPSDRVTYTVAPARAELPERSDAVALYRRMMDQVAALPGVASVGAINILPVPGGNWWTSSLFPEGRTFEAGEEPVAAVRVITGDYFGAMGIPVLRGRVPSARDDAAAEPVVMIDRLAAERYWPGEDPTGRRVALDRPGGERPVTWFRIVGVVDAVHDASLTAAPKPMVYMTLDQAIFGHFRDWGMSLVAYHPGGGDLGSLLDESRQIVAEEFPGLPVYRTMTLDAMVAGQAAERAFTAKLIGAFGTTALLLAAIGVYAVLATMVAERTREIGMRMALGADRGRVVRWVMAEGLPRVVIGLGLGLGAAAVLSRWMESLLFEVRPTDPATYALIAAVLSGVALAASLGPAWRAARVDPIKALRSE